jgi:O-antigen/teichoic acid export membrane protein
MLLVQIIAVAITAHAGPSRTALLAMGRQLSVIKIVVFATMLFLCTLVALVPVMGATGANVAHVLLALVCAICFDVILRRGVASARSQRAAAKADAGASLG